MKSILVSVGLLFVTLLACASPVRDWQGTWQGKIMKMRIVFNITAHQDDCLRGTMDSPDQGAMGIPLDTVITHGDTITVRVKKLQLTYTGRLQPGDSMISGSLTQGMTLKMNLYKQRKPVAVQRPQTPKEPYSYTTRDVSWQCLGNTLNGTLTLPESGRPRLGVVLLNGSGQQDRDGTVMGHKTIAVIADWLTRQGMATLRYDDIPEAVDMAMEEADALSAVEYLHAHAPVKRIALLGHSLGAIEAMHIAATKPDAVCAVIALSAPVCDGLDMMIRQNEMIYHHATGGELTGAQLAEVQAIFHAIDSIHDTKALRQTLLQFLHGDTTQLATLTSPMYTSMVRNKPSQWLKKVKCPILALWGAEDIQVDGKDNAVLLARLRPQATTKVYDGTNHLLQPVDEPSQRLQYASQPITIRPEVLKGIDEWLEQRHLK